MKVLLVRPQAPNALSFTKVLDNEPLELEYLYTALREVGVEAVIFDGLIDHNLAGALRRERPDMVAITGYITQQTVMLRYCREAKALLPGVVTVIGGVHAQLNPGDFYKDEVDYVYRSECVRDFARLALSIGSPELPGLLPQLNGLCHRTEGSFAENPLRPVDIDSLPIPDRSFFYAHRRHYRYLDLTEVATVKTAFSCPYDCNFCYCTHLAGGRYRARSLDLVMEELRHLNAQNVQLVDDDFLVDPQRLRRFIAEVKRLGIDKTFICYARADFVAANPDLVADLVAIGFKYFLVGLEAVTDAELQGMNKRTSVDMNRRCVEVIAGAGAHCIALMIAPIDADRAYFDHLYNWIVSVGLQYVTVSIFTPIPGTRLYEEYKDRLTSSDPLDWDFLHLVLEPTRLSRRQFYAEYRRLFLRLYKIASATGIYSFMDLGYYKNLLVDFLDRKVRGV